MIRFVITSLLFWRISLIAVAFISSIVFPKRPDFLGKLIWSNFDGTHYLVIASQGYLNYQQAFFPLFPLFIALFKYIVGSYIGSALFIVHVTFFASLLLLWKLVKIDFDDTAAAWTTLFLLLFPASFFFVSVYTESLFLMLVLASFIAARKNHWIVASLLGCFAASTKLVGILLLPALAWQWWEQHREKMPRESGKNSKVSKASFHKKMDVKTQDTSYWWLFLIPLGLLGYMVYLSFSVGDPLAFVHVQPAFGANRTGGEIIFLPQVLFRYIKIFFTVSWIEYDFRVAVLEMFMFSFVLGLLLASWRSLRKSYIIFSLLSVVVPTLTGSLSSMPRYVLVAFPVFIALGAMKNQLLKLLLVFSFSLLSFILSALFMRGYFVG